MFGSMQRTAPMSNRGTAREGGAAEDGYGMRHWTRVIAILHARAAQPATAQECGAKMEGDETRCWMRLVAALHALWLERQETRPRTRLLALPRVEQCRTAAEAVSAQEIAPTTCGLRLRPSRARAWPEPSWRARPEVRAGRSSPSRAVAAAFRPSRAQHITSLGKRDATIEIS